MLEFMVLSSTLQGTGFVMAKWSELEACHVHWVTLNKQQGFLDLVTDLSISL